MTENTDHDETESIDGLQSGVQCVTSDVVPVAVGFGSILASLVLKVYP